MSKALTRVAAADLSAWGDRKLDNAIKRGHVVAGKHMSGFQQAAAVTGYMLKEKQRRLGPRKFAPWLEEHFDGARSTAYEYMTMAETMALSVRPTGQIEGSELIPIAPPEGTYSTVVIDPPWAMRKIGRDVRPDQVDDIAQIADPQLAPLDYPTMNADELREFEIPAAPDAHLYLWTTHKFLPLALELTEAWGFRYQCVLTWIKNVGFTPFSFMYSTELVIFARRGSLDLLAKGRRLDFAAKVREHSRKPDEFYDLVRDVSPEPRIDIFSREPRTGFDQWGNETAKFIAEAAR